MSCQADTVCCWASFVEYAGTIRFALWGLLFIPATGSNGRLKDQWETYHMNNNCFFTRGFSSSSGDVLTALYCHQSVRQTMFLEEGDPTVKIETPLLNHFIVWLDWLPVTTATIYHTLHSHSTVTQQPPLPYTLISIVTHTVRVPLGFLLMFIWRWKVLKSLNNMVGCGWGGERREQSPGGEGRLPLLLPFPKLAGEQCWVKKIAGRRSVR